jgi:glycyl-tRNA synthetase
MENLLEKIVSLGKRRGFVFQSSEIYGGLANVYDYGPLGVELMRNIKNCWWEFFVSQREDVVGLDSSILMSPRVWQSSGHTDNFTDVMIDCRKCNTRTRADHLIENFFEKQGKEEKKVEGLSPKELSSIIKENKIACPVCGKFDWTEARKFNLLFETNIGILPERQAGAYLRGEIAQGMFVNFKNVIDSSRLEMPFGLAQSGKVFRNEITKGNFVYRTLEFNLAEIEYFFDPKKNRWEDVWSDWKKQMEKWLSNYLGIGQDKIFWREHTPEERSHYSQKTEDIEFIFPFGKKELYGLAYRTDFDLKNHINKSGQDLSFFDQKSGEKIIPHVIEPTFGLDRTFLAILCNSYFEDKENKRTILRLPERLAPYKAAVFPLVANKPEIRAKAKEVYRSLLTEITVAWDERGNIGKRYYAQDEIGTLACLTVDYQTLEDNTVTIRDRDTMKQQRVRIEELNNILKNKNV